MSNDIIIGIKASDGGSIDNLTGKAEQLRATLRDASEAASKIRVPVATVAARQGVAASQPSTMSQSASVSQPKSAAYKAASGPGNTASDTNLSRGLAGQTGASGRDFAAQAQGLGGLVHVYATFAANLFAVSAAFNALSKAMDTTNLIKGLDQLGAASGRTYSTLAKQMVSVADGAISMQQAMSSTAMATAAGMSNANVLRMTEVAKKASQALGRDMTDSMDRLTKGIIKTQPELLDELGIMARVIPAQQAYSKEIGKTVDQLSTYEKQQAFANAVLAEGEAKFSNIKLDANPYSKMSASMQNIAQAGLSLVNTVLSPIAKLLAESPMGLATVMAGIAAVLIKQAIPAIGQFRKGLEEANKLKLEKITDFSTATAQGESGRYDLEMQNRAAAVYMRDKDLAGATAEQKKKWEIEVDRIREDISNKSEARSKRLFSHERNIETQKDRMYKDAGISQAKLMVSNTSATYGSAAAFSELKHQISELKAGTATIDIGDKMGQAVPAIGKVRGAFLLATGSVSIFGAALGSVMNILGPYIAAFGALAIVLQAFDSWASGATKQQDAFNNSIESSTAAIKTASDAIDGIYSKSKGIVSVESSNAATNAITGINDALKTQITAFNKLEARQNIYEKAWDSLWSALGKGNLDNLIKSVSEDVPAALDVMALKGNTVSNKLKKALSEIIPNVDINSSKSIKNYLDGLSSEDKQKKINQISKAISSVEESSKKSTNALNDFVAGLQKTQDLSDELTNTLKRTGDGAISDALIKSADQLGEALKSPTEGLNAIIKLGNDMKTISLLPPDLAKQIASARTQAEGLARDLEKAMKARQEANTDREDLKASGGYTDNGTIETASTGIGAYIGGVIGGAAAGAFTGGVGIIAGAAIGAAFVGYVSNRLATLFPEMKTDAGVEKDAAFDKAEKAILTQMQRVEAFVKLQEPVALKIQQAGLDRFEKSLSALAAKADTISQKAAIDSKARAGLDTADDEYRMRDKELDQQQVVLEAAYAQQKEIEKNTDALNLSTSILRLSIGEEKLRAAQSKGDKVGIAEATAEVTQATKAKFTSQTVIAKSMTSDKNLFDYQKEKYLPKKPAGMSNEDYNTSIQSANIEMRKRELQARELAAQKKVIGSERGANATVRDDKKVEERIRTQEREAELNTLNNKLTLDTLGLYEKLSQGYSEGLAQAKLTTQLKAEDYKYDTQKLALEKQLQLLARQPQTNQAIALKAQVTEKMALLALTRENNKELFKANQALETFNQAQKKLTEQYNHQKVLVDQIDIISNARISLQQQQLQQAQSLGYITDSDYITRKATLELQKEQIASTRSISDAEEAVARARDKQNKIRNDEEDNRLKYGNSTQKPDLSEAKLAAANAVTEAEAKAKTARSQSKINKDLINSNKSYDLILAAEKELVRISEQKLKVVANATKLLEAQLDLQEQILNQEKEMGRVSEEGYARELNDINLKKSRNAYAEQQLALQKKMEAALRAYNGAQEAAAKQAEDDLAERNRVAAATRESQAARGVTQDLVPLIQVPPPPLPFSQAVSTKADVISGLQQEMDLNKSTNDILEERYTSAILHKQEMIKQNELLKSQESLATSLTDIFGDVGAALGETVKQLSLAAREQEKLTAIKLRELKAIEDNKDMSAADKIKAEEETKIKYQKKSTEAELVGIAATAKANKKMFDEKSGMYRAISSIEKVSSAMTMSLKAKELATSIANDGLLIASKIPAIFASFMAALGPFGPPAAALAIAAFLGVATGGGGGEPEKPQTYDEFKAEKGNATGVGGVAGDSSAINEGLQNTLKDLLDVASPQLQFTSMMTTYLKGIEYNTAMMTIGVEKAFVSRDMGVKQGTVDVNQAQTLGAGSGIGGLAAGTGLGMAGLVKASNFLVSSVYNVGGSLMNLGGVTGLVGEGILNLGLGIGTAASSIASGVGILTGGLTTTFSGISSAVGGLVSSLGGAGAAGASLASGLAGIGSILPGVGTVVGALVGTLITSIPAVQDFLFGTTEVTQSVSGFGVAIEDQTLATASSAIQMQRYDDVLTKTSRDRGAFEQAFNWFTGGDTSNEETSSTQRVYTDLRTPAEKAFAKQIQDTYAGIKNTLSVASSVLDVDSSNLASFRTTLKDLDLSSGTAEEKTARLNAEIGKNADAFAKKLLPSIDEFTHSGDTAFQAYAKLASAQEQVGQITDALGIKSIKYSEIINKQGDYAAEMMRQSISNAEAGSGIGKIIENFSGSAGDMTNLFVKLRDVRTSFTALGYSGELVNAQLLKGAGGIDNLANALSAYESKYLTSADRTKIATAKLTDAWKPLTNQLAAAGLTVPKTKDGFKELVQSLEKGGEGSSELLGKVLLLADGFDKVATSAEETLNKSLDQIQKMYEIQGRGDMVKAMSRAKELKALDANLRPMQEYLYALEDEAALKGKLQTAYDKLKTSLTGTISSLKNSISSLNQYKVSSQFGDKSTLTAQQQYDAAKSQFLSTAQLAGQKLDSSATPDQIAARDKALGALQGTAEELKNQSRAQFASSDAYQNDFDLIQRTIDDTTASLGLQQTDAEKQLEQATASTNYLSTVADNTKTTADLMSEFLAAQSNYISGTMKTDNKTPANLSSAITNTLAAGAVNTSNVTSIADSRGFAIPGYAVGGIASGVSLVGERGPELVDFQNPGRVYPASQTNMLGDNTGLVNELKALRDEVAKLREDQREQTGQIIISNYDANKKNAEVVASTTESVAKMQEWKERSKVVIS